VNEWIDGGFYWEDPRTGNEIRAFGNDPYRPLRTNTRSKLARYYLSRKSGEVIKVFRTLEAAMESNS